MSTRELPRDIAAESGVISCALVNPTRTLPLYASIGLASDHFSSMAHSRFYAEMMSLYRSGKTVDAVMLSKQLEKTDGLYDQVAGVKSSDTPKAGRDYAIRIIQSAIARDSILAAGKCAKAAYRANGNIMNLISDLQATLDGLTATHARTVNPDLVNPADALAAGDEWSVQLGVPWFDERIRFPSGRIHGIAADPSAGKSTVAIQAAVFNLLAGNKVALFLAEDDVLDVQLTMLAQTQKVDMAFVNRIRFEQNFKTEDNLCKVREIWDEHYKDLPLRIFMISAGPQEVLDNVRALDDRYFVIIDHAFAVVGQGDRRIEDHRAFSTFYNGLNKVSKSGNHVTVVLNQFKLSGRSGDGRGADAQYGGSGIRNYLWTIVHMWIEDEELARDDDGWIAVSAQCEKAKARLVIDDAGKPVDPMDGPGVVYINPDHRLFATRDGVMYL